MSDRPSSGNDAEKQAEGGDMFRYRGIRLFGLGLQDAIRYFFGGNASIAIIVLGLVCFILLREATMFFPDYHEDLVKYRRSGQELADYVRAEVDRHNNIYSPSNIAYFAERNESSLEEDAYIKAYEAVQRNVESEVEIAWEELEEKTDELEDLREDLEEMAEAPAPQPDADAVDAADAENDPAGERAALEERIAALESEVAAGQEALREKMRAELENSGVWNLGRSDFRLTRERRAAIEEAVLHYVPGVEEEHPKILELEEISREKKAEATERLADFKATIDAMRDAVRPLKDHFYDLREVASENKKELVSYSTAHARRKALLKAARQAEEESERERFQQRAEEVDITEPDYDKLNEPIYASIPEHQEILVEFESEMAALVPQLPAIEEMSTQSGKDNLRRAQRAYDGLLAVIEKNKKRIPEWRHDEPYSWPRSIASFFLGRDWITNSSWHEFYGMMPLFLGSFLIAVTAIVVAVPFSISAAIYVNQLAPFKEQNFIKPSIEFIEAIPSVVLGLFGVLVFGEALRNLSQVEWLSWVPGFPMAERLNILNAGLLLALMATPTIFTLAEDALNNVPQAFTENSLAMGASKLQTVIRIVVPCALSGIIAAVLLGFGRIIGETMVVLLVAGNKIKVPDFSEGIGVIMQPAHTMTGIIAQELGEVSNGSLHWRALFMVGMVLFIISLAVNYASQQILKRYQKF